MFGLGMVIFESRQDAIQTEATIAALRSRISRKTEFKFSKSSDVVRDSYFQALVSCPFVVRAIIVRKEVIHSDNLRRDADKFYNYFVKQLLKYDDGKLQRASVRIDGSGSRDFQRALGKYLRHELGQRVKDVKMSDSDRDPLMQLADMCIGAITRAERDRPNRDRWKLMLSPRIADVWMYG